jgi:hypothetical protein
MQKEWIRKAKQIRSLPDPNADPALLFSDKAGVYSEFARIVCIGIGSLNQTDGKWKMRLTTLTGFDEKELLKEFCQVLGRFQNKFKDFRFCGHNIKEFDIPFICRRLVINALPLPGCLIYHGRKPWEVTHLDTLELWKFGDYKNYTSLSLLASVLGIPSPKDDLDGSMVAGVFYNEKNLGRIGTYCMQDVLTSARVFLRLMGHDIDPEPVFI